MLANKQCIMIEGHWFNNSKNFSFLKNLEDTKLRIFFHNPDFLLLSLLLVVWSGKEGWISTVNQDPLMVELGEIRSNRMAHYP